MSLTLGIIGTVTGSLSLAITALRAWDERLRYAAELRVRGRQAELRIANGNRAQSIEFAVLKILREDPPEGINPIRAVSNHDCYDRYLTANQAITIDYGELPGGDILHALVVDGRGKVRHVPPRPFPTLD
jgi:hypothetical protein